MQGKKPHGDTYDRRPAMPSARLPPLPASRAVEMGGAREEVMPEDTHGPDRSKIDMSKDDEVKYWMQHLGVTRDELQKVVDRVGTSAKDVEKEFGF